MLIQLGRFILVGGMATALHYAILVGLVGLAGVQPVLASTIGYVLSALVNYALNRAFTFRSRVPHFTGLARFAVIAASGLVLNAFVMAIATQAIGLHYVVAQIVATGAVLLWNFHAHRRWTFFAGASNPGGQR